MSEPKWLGHEFEGYEHPLLPDPKCNKLLVCHMTHGETCERRKSEHGPRPAEPAEPKTCDSYINSWDGEHWCKLARSHSGAHIDGNFIWPVLNRTLDITHPTPAPLKDVREAWAWIKNGKFYEGGLVSVVTTSDEAIVRLIQDFGEPVRVRVTVEEIE